MTMTLINNSKGVPHDDHYDDDANDDDEDGAVNKKYILML